MTGQPVLDAAALIATASGATAVVVQLVIAFAKIDSARIKVATAVLVATGLTILYALSGGLFVIANAFALAIAAITIAAAGAGVQHTLTDALPGPKGQP